MRDALRPELTFPFWMLVHRGEYPWRPVMLTPGNVAAFTTHELAAAFAAERGDPDWEFRLVARPTFLRMADGLRLRGVRGVHLDPSLGGEVIDLDPAAGGLAPSVTTSHGGAGRLVSSASPAGK
jgi:hypothetical protein